MSVNGVDVDWYVVVCCGMLCAISGPFPVTNARYVVTAFPVTTVQDRAWNIECPCGALFSALFHPPRDNNTNGILSANTTSTSLTLPSVTGVQYAAVVTVMCLQEDSCSPATVYGQFVSAPKLLFTGGGPYGGGGGGGMSGGAKAAVGIVSDCVVLGWMLCVWCWGGVAVVGVNFLLVSVLWFDSA